LLKKELLQKEIFALVDYDGYRKFSFFSDPFQQPTWHSIAIASLP